MRTNLFLTAALSLCLCAASTAQTLPAYLPTDGLVGWWPFNGNANDESGNGNNGTVNGATLTEDRFGIANAAFNFDDANWSWGSGGDQILIPFDSSFNTSHLSVAVWAFRTTDGYPGQNQTIINRYQFGYDTPGGEVWQIILTPAPSSLINTQVIQGGSGNNQPYLLNTGDDLSTGFWAHIVLTFDGNSLKQYVNGLLMDELLSNGISLNDNGYSGISIGVSSQGNGNWGPFGGKIDDIAIYNRALTPEEITALYTGEPVNPPTACNPLPSNLQNGLVGYWPFCGNANDESGNGNNGTVNGATLTEDRFGAANAAYDFDGVDDYINYGDVTFLDNSTQATWNWWLKTDEILPITDNNEYVSVLRKDLSWIPMQFANDSYDYYRSLLFQGGIGSGNLIWDSTTIEYSVWSMYTISKTYNSMILYKNGVIVDSLSYTGEIENSSSPFLLGRAYTFNDLEAFNGQLDDIGIWNRALTPEEVQQLYTLNACTFTVYDTVTVENVVTVYDTVLTTVTDTLIINTLITALAPPANTNTIKVFPNPAGSTLTIDYGNYALMNGYQLRIENSLGQEVFQTNINQQSDTLNLGSWGGNGLYFVHIVEPQGNTIDIRKIVLQ